MSMLLLLKFSFSFLGHDDPILAGAPDREATYFVTVLISVLHGNTVVSMQLSVIVSMTLELIKVQNTKLLGDGIIEL